MTQGLKNFNFLWSTVYDAVVSLLVNKFQSNLEIHKNAYNCKSNCIEAFPQIDQLSIPFVYLIVYSRRPLLHIHPILEFGVNRTRFEVDHLLQWPSEPFHAHAKYQIIFNTGRRFHLILFWPKYYLLRAVWIVFDQQIIFFIILSFSHWIKRISDIY